MTPSKDFRTRGSLEQADQFLAAVAHDLKEPLRTVTCCAELLVKQWNASLDEQTALLLTRIVDSTRRMQQMIEDATTFALLDGSGAEWSEVDMKQVLEFTLSNLETVISRAGAVVTSDPLPMVTADFGAMVRVFQNLITNAIIYRSEEPPRIRVGCTGGAGWIFSVADNGIGIER